MDGETAEAVVRTMSRKAQEQPTAAEGFHKVVVLQTDSQHSEAASTLAALPPSAKLLQHAQPSAAVPAGSSSPPLNTTAPLDTVGGRDPASSAAPPATPGGVLSSPQMAAPPARDALSVLMRSAKQYREGGGASSSSSCSPLQPTPHQPPRARALPTSDSLATDEVRLHPRTPALELRSADRELWLKITGPRPADGL